MERHPDSEILWTVDVPLIQTIVRAGDLNDHTEQPDAEEVEAFIIEPGQVIIMNPGTWHAPAIPTLGKALYFFIGCDHPREPGWEDTPWIPFENEKEVVIQK